MRATNSLPCGCIQCRPSHKDKDRDRRNADRNLQPLICLFFLRNKRRRHCFFCIYLECFINYEQADRNTSTSQSFLIFLGPIQNVLYNHTFYPYLPNSHKDIAQGVRCADSCLHSPPLQAPHPPPLLCYMTMRPPTKGCKMLMSRPWWGSLDRHGGGDGRCQTPHDVEMVQSFHL